MRHHGNDNLMNDTMGGMISPSLHADDLILFARIAEAGSFTRAAERTGFPKATLSRRLARLEDTYGERLVQRTTRHLALTEFGKRMLEHARQLSDTSEEAMALALNRRAEPQGRLRVSLPPDFRELAVPDLLARFARRYPEVELDLDLSARRVDLLAERFDVALRAAVQLPDDSTLVARRIATRASGLYANRDYLERHGAPDTPAALSGHRGLILSSRGEPQPWRLSRGEDRWEGFPHHALTANSLGLQQDLALRGLGIVELTREFARGWVDQGLLLPVLPDWQSPAVTIWCVTAGRKLLPRRTEAFIATVREVLAGDSAA